MRTPNDYIDEAEEAFWDDVSDYRLEAKRLANRNREYRESGYWPAEEDECSPL